MSQRLRHFLTLLLFWRRCATCGWCYRHSWPNKRDTHHCDYDMDGVRVKPYWFCTKWERRNGR